MSETLFSQLRKIGIDEALAHEVDKALSPEHVATKKEFMVMQEAIMQLQMKTDTSFHKLENAIMKVDANLRVEIATLSRQFWITFGGIITTILSVFAVNWYFH